VGVWLAGVFWDRYGATSISAQAERTDSTPNGWEFGVTVGMAGGRGAAVAPRDKEEEVGGERGEGGGIRSLMGRAGMGWGGVRGQGQGLMQGRAGRQVRAVSDHILAGGEEVGRFLKQPEETEV